MKIGVVCVIKEAWGGSEELWAAMAHEAIAEGHEVIVSLYKCGEVHPKMQALVDKGVEIVYRRGFVKPGLSSFKRVLKKAQIIVANKLSNPFNSFLAKTPDIILYNGTSYTCVEDSALFFVLQRRAIPYCYLSHIAADYYRPIGLRDISLVASAFQKAKKNFFIAKKTIEITERQIGEKISNTLVVRNPVNLDNTDPIPYPALTGTIQFATVGLLVVAHKGQDMLLEAFSSPEWMQRDWHLNIYGSGVDEKFITKLISHYKLKDRVTLHGKVNNVRKIWELNHLLLMPSLMEGMPLAVVEAMLCERPSVVTDVGGHTEWITDLLEGYVSPAPSVSALSKTLESAWNQQSRWKAMGTNARNKALQLYTPLAGKYFLKKILSN